MADGQVLIDSKLDVSGVEKGVKQIKQELDNLSNTVSKAAKVMEESFSDVDYRNTFDGLSDSAKRAYAKIEMIRNNDADDNEQKAQKIAAAFQELGEDQAESQKKAWAIIEAESKDGSHKVIDDLDDIADKADDTGDQIGGLSDIFKDVFGANFLANISSEAFEQLGEFVIDTAKQSVEAAAEIKAANAQFEQTFKGVETTARKALQSIADETGITTTRLQDSYTKIFAFSKSAGADTETALNLSARAMRAAADVAAYFDISIEDATETLQSFIKGNYENDSALNISATETTRNAKANELYAKSFNELSESQKVDTLLAMVEAGNAASGALGQAARESGSWANVMGELEEAWRQLLGVLGSPILEGLTPLIQGITAELQKLTNVTAGENLADEMEGFKQSISDIDAEFDSTTEAIERNAAMADTYVSKLKDLETQGFEPNTAASREYANAVSLLNDLYPDLNLQIEEQTGLLNDTSKAQLKNLDTLKKKAQYSALEKKYTAAMQAQEAAVLAVQEAERELLAVQSERQAIEDQLSAATGKSGAELIELYHNRAEAVGLLSSEELKLLDQMMVLQQEEIKLKSNIEDGNTAIAEQDAGLQDLKAECDTTAESLGIVTEAEAEVAAATDEVAKKFQEAKESARDSIDSQVGYFDELDTKSDKSADDIIANWQKQQQAYENYAQNLQKAIDMGLDDKLIQQLSDGSEQSMMYLAELVGAAETDVTKINEAFDGLDQSRDKVAEIAGAWKEDLTVVTEEVTTAVDNMVTLTAEGADTAVGNAADKVVVLLEPATEAVNTLKTDVSGALTEIEGYFTESWGRITETVTTSIGDMDIASITADIEELKGNLETLPTDVSGTVNQMYSDAGSAATNALSDAATAIQNNVFTPLEETGTATAEGIGESFRIAADTFRESWTGMSTWYESNVVHPIKTGTEEISNTWTSKMGEMKGETASAWAEMVQIVNSSINQMQSKIDSLTGKTIYITAEKTGSGASLISYSGYDGKAYSPDTAAYTPATLEATPSMPYLATGAVIPPMAIPSYSARTAGMSTDSADMISTLIAQKVAQVMVDSLGNIEIDNRLEVNGNLAALVRLLYPEFKSEARRKGISLATEVISFP